MAAHDAAQVRICMDKFTALETKMATVTNADGTGTLDRLNEEFFNHDGRPGLKSQFMLYLQEQRTLREQNDKKLKADADTVKDTLAIHYQELAVRDRKKDRKINIILAVCAILALFHGVPTIITTIEKAFHAITVNEIHVPKIFPSNIKGQLYTAHNQTQDATNHEEVKPWQLNR